MMSGGRSLPALRAAGPERALEFRDLVAALLVSPALFVLVLSLRARGAA